MNYYKITCMNGYAGYDEDYYIKAESEGLAEDIGNDILYNEYSFLNPERFVDDPDDEEAIEEYQENCCFWIDKISKEEYLDAKRQGYD